MVMPPPQQPMAPPQQPMAPGPPQQPMGMPMMDPTAVYEMAQMVQQEMERQAELMMEPRYPAWYREQDYPKPDPKLVLGKARQLETEFAALRRRIHEEHLALDPNRPLVGHFNDFDPDDDDQWVDTAISGEVELQSYQLADAQLSFDATPRKLDERDEAAKKVDFALACLEHAERIHSISGNGPLKIEKARTLLTTGRLAWHCLLNLDADEDEMPFVEHLVDPASCFPVFESQRGMRTMIRVYQTTVGEAVAAFDDGDGTLYRELIQPAVHSVAPNPNKRREEEACEIVEYWDRRWRVIFIDGKQARTPLEHAYGFVPFVYKVGPLGMPAFMRTPDHGVSIGSMDYHRYHNRDVSMPTKGIGLPTLMKLPTRLREAVYTRMLTAFNKSVDPPLVVEMDDVTYPEGAPELSRQRGDVSPIRMNRQAIQEVPTNPNPQVLMPILQGVADNTSRLSQPPTAHGLNDHSNVSGYATQGLNEAGRIKLVPWLRTLEEFERECMEMRFRMYRDWGYLIDQGGRGEYGTITVPRFEAGPDEDQTFELTPGDLRRVGITIKASMTSMPLQMLGPTANAIGILMELGLMDEIGGLKLLNTQNPYKVLQRIQANKVLNDPALIEADVLQHLADAGEHGKVAYLLARKLGEQMGGMGGPPGPPGQPEPPGAMGDSQAAMGQPPGPGSGPQGPMAPSDPYGTEP